MTQYNRSNLWKLTLALLAVVLCVTLTVGVYAFAADGDSGEASTYTVTNVALKEGAQVYDDHTAATIKDVLVVTGSVNGGEEQVLTAAQYSVTFADGKNTPTAGTGVTITVGDYAFTCDVVAAQLLETRIIATQDFQKSGSYFVNSDGYYAFVQGMTAEQVQSRLAVELVYTNHSEYKNFGDGVQWNYAPAAFGDTSNNNDANIALSLTVDGIDDPVTGDVTFAALKTVGLKLLDGWTKPTDITPATEVASFAPSLQGYVVYVFNSGYEGSSVTVQSSETGLNYGGLYVGATADALLNCSEGDTFEKVLEIPAQESGISALKVPLTVKYTGYAGMSTSLSQSGLGAQVARSDKVNLGEVYATVSFTNEFGDDIETLLYLKDIPGIDGDDSPIKATFYEGTTQVSTLTMRVTRIRLEFTSKGGVKASRTYSGLQISPMTVSAPSIKDTELTYSDLGCSTEMDGLIKDDPAYGDDMIISAVSAGAEIQADGKTVKFNKGGTYTITVSFTNGSSSDFVFQQGSGNGEVNANDPTIATYTVNVLKAPITVSLNGFQAEYQYGDYGKFGESMYGKNGQEPAYSVTGTASETMQYTAPAGNNLKAPALPLPANYALPAEDGKTTVAPSFLLYYTGTTADGDSYEDYAFPNKRGTYQVHVITAETGWYDAGELETPFEFTIVERRLSLGSITIPAVDYIRGKTYSLSEILTTVTVGNLVNPDDKNTVLEWDWATSGTAPQHAGDYKINFKIKNTNYKWDDTESLTKQAAFTINALNLGLNLTLSNSTFTYGAVTLSDTLTRTKDGATVDSFYAVVSDAKYYKVNDDSSETLMTDASFNTWNIGTYKVKYTTSVHSDDQTGDYNLPTAEQTFTITPRVIAQVKLDNTSDTFSGSAINFAIVNADGSALSNSALVNGQTYADILTVAKVSALLMDNVTNVDNRRISIGNVITAIDAGNYTFKVTLNTNYTWGGTVNSDGLEEITLTFVINKATVAIDWAETSSDTAADWNTKLISYPFDGDAHYPTLTAQDGLTLSYGFTDSNSQAIVDTAIINAGTYYVTVTDFTGVALSDASYTLKVNYELPTTLQQSFVIVSMGMAKPTLIAGSNVSGNAVTVVYNGKAVDFTSFIDKYSMSPSDGGYMLNGTPMLAITFDGSANAPKNVKGTGNEEEYTVTIVPAGNFVWSSYTTSETEDVTFTLKITRLPIEISWIDDSFNGYVYNGQAQTVAKGANYTLNSQQSDVIDVTFTYSGAKLTGNDAINAGDYTVTLDDITGELANNYTTVGATNPSHALTIAKYSLAVPSIVGSDTESFGVTSKSFALQDTSSVTGFDWDSALNVSVAGQWKFNDKEYGAHPANSATFSFATGTLTFSHAGEYVITFSISDDDGNYQWADNLTGAQTRTLTVNRQQVTAPALDTSTGTQRTIEFKADAENNAIVQYPTGLTVDVAGLSLTLAYGEKQDYETVTSTANSSAYGLYFVKVTIGGSHLDYEWIENTSDKKNIGFVPEWGHTVYTADETSVYLHYMITKGILYVDYTVTNYTFGDNGYNGNYGHAINGKTDPLLWGGTDKQTIIDNGGVEGLVFYKFENSAPTNKPSNIGDFEAYTDLVNGLPWEAGYYGVLITISFGENSPFETITAWYAFEIEKREITVSWSGDVTVTYDGQAHGLTATVTNEIFKNGDAATDKIAVPTLTVALNTNGDLPTNASVTAYTLNAYIVASSGNASNFCLPTSGISNTLTINKRTVRLNVVDSTYGSVYGNALTYAQAAWAYVTDCPEDNKFVQSDTTGYITYNLYAIGSGDTKGTLITSATPNAGSYWLVPELTAEAQDNYVLDCDYSAVKYTVAQRAITVALNADNATSVYGQNIAVYKEGENGVYTVTWNNPDGQDASQWLVGSSVTNVFTLTTTATNESPVGNYPVTLTVVDGVNYAITVGGDVVTASQSIGNWEITNATITNASVATKTTPTYNGQGHAIIGTLVDAKATLVKPTLNNSSVQWFYTTASLAEIEADTAVWTNVTSLTQINAINQNYYFKVTANNHNDLVVGACDVVIDKAELKVSINLAIWYGEANPATLTGGAYKATIAELLKANTSGGVFSVTGFKTRDGVLETIGDVIDEDSGTFSYTIDTYGQGSAVGSYDITFVNTDLTATNYTFVNDDTHTGVLTVNKLNLYVAIADTSNVYYDTFDKVTFATTITLPKSTYDESKDVELTTAVTEYINATHSALGYAGHNVFTLATTAFADTNSATHSNIVGSYAISGSVNDNNYDVTFSGSNGTTAKHAITPATLTIDGENIEGYSAAYDELAHNALVLKATGKNTVVDYVTTKGNMAVTVRYYAADNALTDDELSALDWNTVGKAQMPQYIDVCNKVVYVLIQANNHDDVCLSWNVQITQGTNSFTNESQLDINNWTYGLYDALDNTDGYNATIVNPLVAFDSVTNGDHANNTLNVTLIRNGSAIDGLTGTYNTISALFAFMWNNGLFDVGDYTLTVTMDGNDNYTDLEKEITFTVTAKELTITAINQTVTYGNDFTAGYTYEVTGYVVSKTGGAKETANIAFAGMSSTDFFTTAYAKGRENGSVGNYAITTTANAVANNNGNYTFTYVTEGKELTVTPREVTVSVGNYISLYNAADAGSTQLLSSIVKGSFYEEDTDVIVLRTMAIAGYGLTVDSLSATTNDVIVAERNVYGQPSTLAAYPVYVVWGSQAKKDNDATAYNYAITVNGSYNRALSDYQSPCDTDKTINVIINGDTPIGNGAGSYMIERSMLGITYNGVYHKVGDDEVLGTVYSGAVNYYKATPDDENVQMTFSYGYNKNTNGNFVDITADQVINVGYYTAYGRLTSDNYYGSQVNMPFQITAATITLTAKSSTVEYGTTLSGNPEDVNDRFVYGGYDYDKGTLLQEVYDAYIAAHKVTYKVDNYTAKTPVGSDYITPVCANDTNGNIVIAAEHGTLTIVKRNVTVTLYGYSENELAQCYYLGTYTATQAMLKSIYENNWAKFISVDNIGDSGDSLDKLAVTFTLPNNAVGAKSDGYGMSVSSGNSNYNVTFKTSQGRTAATISSSDEDAPKFVINKAKLTVYAHLNSTGVYTVTYGNALSYNDLNNLNSINYSVDGTQNGEIFRNLIGVEPTYSVLNGAKAYAAWESNVGETYTVSVKFVDENGNVAVLDNYELDSANGATYVTTTLTINKRVITASTKDQVFQWDGVNYHDGMYGKAHEAVWTFADNTFVSTEANANVNEAKRPAGYSVSYTTQDNSAYNQVKGKAPTTVGEYKVTITLAADGNYTFANGLSAEQPFNITQRIIREGDLTWDPSSKFVEGEEKSGSFTMANYINAIMEVRMFTFYPNGQSGSTEIYQGSGSDVNAYYFDGQAMKINADGLGRYEVIIQLKDSATHNYRFEGEHNALIYSSFAITSTSVNLTLTIEDWTYGTTPNLPNARINGDINEGIIIEYSIVTDVSNIDLYYNKAVTGADVQNMLDSISGLQVSESWYRNANSLTFNAGYYVVRARYSATVTGENGDTYVNVVKYYVFNVSKASVNLPVKADTDEYTYNGAEQSLTIDYPTTLVRASYNGHTGTSDSGIIVYATNASTYNVTFTIIDTDNYQWEDGGTDAYTLSWTIAKDTTINGLANDNILFADEQSDKEYGDVTVDGEATKAGYDGRITRSFVIATDKDFETITEWANDVEWTSGLPENVGNYFVKLVLQGNANFTQKVAYVKLNVTAKEVIVTASGTVTYGNDWTAGVHYEGTGLYGHRVTGNATFALVEDYGTLQAGGEYYVIVESENGVAKGLTMSDDKGNDVGANYVIKVAQGRLTVNQRLVNVALGNLSAQYGEDKYVDPATATVTTGRGQLIDGDNLGLQITSTATAASPVGGYVITATASNGNYNVVVVNGIYTITERRIRIEIEATNGVYLQTDASIVIKNVIDDESGKDITDLVATKGLVLTLNYRGTINKNNEAYNNNEVPTMAGSYTATARGANNSNFIIVGEAFTSFVIDKQEVDVTLITIASQSYTGEALTPVLDTDKFVAAYGDGIYEQLAHEAFVNAGAHTVTLRINDFDNYKWKSVETVDREIIFTIDKAKNSLTSAITIDGWTYGGYDAQANLPNATVKFGQDQITFVYSNAVNGTFTSGAPASGDVGDYWVKVTVPATDNYEAFTSEAVKFAISKLALVKPSLTIITDGEGKNDVYTGDELASAIVGFDMSLMRLNYDGKFNLDDGIAVVAVNAGTYTVKLSIRNTNNYCWQNEDNNDIELTWIIAPKAVAKPTEDTRRFIVNGQVLTYMPEGFDEAIMTVSGNETAYGGKFDVTIGLKDKSNYVWSDGGTDDYTLSWNVVGINTVFIIVISVLSGVTGIALIALGIQLLLDHRRRRLIDLAIDARSQAEAMKAPQKKNTDLTDKGGND